MVVSVIDVFTVPSNSVTDCNKTFFAIKVKNLINHRQIVDKLSTPLKEVIQPHVLVGLPCYDLTPITGFTLDAVLPCGLN